MSLEPYERWRWLKSEGKWPSWLRNPRLLKWAFFVATIVYRLWLIWRWLSHAHDG